MHLSCRDPWSRGERGGFRSMTRRSGSRRWAGTLTPGPLDDRSRRAVGTGGSTERRASVAPAGCTPPASPSSSNELAVWRSWAQWRCGETIVEHALGYRAGFGYPQRLCLICPICFWQLGAARSRAPVVVAALRRAPAMPLGDRHLSTASAVGVSMRRLIPAGDALQALLDLYGIEDLSLLDTAFASAGGHEEGVAGRREGSAA
jgi:hypothetical protein